MLTGLRKFARGYMLTELREFARGYMLTGLREFARGCMLTGLREFVPELHHWFLWSYGRTSPLFYQVKHVAKKSDPLSSQCFVIGLQDALRQVQTVIAELVD